VLTTISRGKIEREREMSDEEVEQEKFHGVAVPNDLKSLRACKVCTLVMTYDQFYRNGKFFLFFNVMNDDVDFTYVLP